jgi:hypothetical protein
LLTGWIVFLLPATVLSKEIRYDFVEGAYKSITTFDGDTDLDAHGFSLVWSSSLSPDIAITTSLAESYLDHTYTVDYGFGPVSLDLHQNVTSLSGGLTVHTPIATRTDLFGNLSILKNKVKTELEDESGFPTEIEINKDMGNVITVGIRHMTADRIEINLILARVDIFEETNNAFIFGGRFYSTETLSIGIHYQSLDNTDTLSFSTRVAIQ